MSRVCLLAFLLLSLSPLPLPVGAIHAKAAVKSTPTYAELQTFLADDAVNLPPYSNSYNCKNFVFDLLDRATEDGIAGWPVEVWMTGGVHMITAFLTSDKGFV